MTLWLDDERAPWKYGYVGALWAKTVEEAIALMLKHGNKITFASLDHDLIVCHNSRDERLLYEQGLVGNGTEVALWIVEHGFWPIKGINIHSLNPAARQRMYEILKRHAPCKITQVKAEL